MKKWISAFLAVLMLAGLLGAGNMTAAAAGGEITVYLDGEQLEFDQPPIARNGRTLVPVRAIFEALGATVTWNDPVIYSIRGDVSIAMMLGENVMTKDSPTGSQLITLDVAPIALNNRTLVPVRAVSEAFDCQVTWDGTASRVDIYTAGGGAGSTGSTGMTAGADQNRVYFNPGHADTVLYRNAIYEGDTLYFTFVNRAELYVYDGSSVRTLNAGSLPRDILVQNGMVYYFGNSNQAVYRMDAATGDRHVLFNENGELDIDKLILYRDYLLVATDLNDAVYAVNVNTGASTLLYEAKALSNGALVTAAQGKVFILDHLYDNSSWSCSLFVADPATGGSQTLYTGLGTQLFPAADGSGVYFCEGDEGSSQTYYFHNASTGARQSVSQSAYNDAKTAYLKANDSCWQDDWTFGSTNNSIYRQSRNSDLRETLYNGSGSRYLTNSDSQVAFIQSADGFNAGSGSWGFTAVYIMDVNGNNRIEIINNGAGATATTDTGGGDGGSSSLTPITCRVCNGQGWVVCPYCHGAGFSFGEICPLCGGSGRQTCAGCQGSGHLYPQQ